MRLTSLLMALLLTACAAPSRPPERAIFDLGPPAGGGGKAALLRAVEVTAPSWLATPAMQYRLLYADAARRRDYAESRWAAPPAELLAQQLRRQLAAEGAGRCRLQVELDEFVQAFATADSSRMILEGRATLFADGAVVARRRFALAPPAPTADARGGVAAAAEAAAGLGSELADWLAGQRDRCRG